MFRCDVFTGQMLMLNCLVLFRLMRIKIVYMLESWNFVMYNHSAENSESAELKSRSLVFCVKTSSCVENEI